MTNLLQDLRFAVRLLIRNRAVTLVAVLSLALGIGANTTVFTLVNAILLQRDSRPRHRSPGDDRH